MSSSFVVELNQNFAAWSRPGEYEVQLAQPISINEGDQLSFRQCSLDSNITDQDTILITSDQVLSATFSYYEVNYDGTDKQSVGTGGGQPVTADYSYYAAYNNVETVTVTGIQLDIIGYAPADNPATPDIFGGSYVVGTNGIGSGVDPAVNFLATFTYIDLSGTPQDVTFTASNVKVDTDPAGDTFYYTDNPTGVLNMQVTPFIMRANSLKFASVQGFWPGDQFKESSPFVTFNTGAWVPRASAAALFDNEYPFQVGDFNLGTITVVSNGNTGNVLQVSTVNVTLKAGRYDPQSLSVEITQLLSSAGGLKPSIGGADQIYAPVNPFLIRTDDSEYVNLVMNKVPAVRTNNIVFQNGSSYKYFNATNPSSIPAYYVGATEFSLEYDVGGGQVFQVSYCHMPLSDPAKPGEQDIGLYTTGTPGSNLKYHTVTSASGILFHDLQPASFWQNKLGLREKLIVPLLTDLSGVKYYTLPSMLRSITFGFQGLGSFLLPPTANPGTNPVTYPDFRKMNPLVPTVNPLYLNVTGQSRAIIGDTITVNSQGGYFLIECLNAFRSTGGYIDTVENRRYISAVVSSQYDSNNVITGFSDSDIAGYIHRGASYLISSVVVRILNPLTKLPVDNLGPNNCIWLQIQKQAEIQSQTVAHPKKKPIIIKRKKDEGDLQSPQTPGLKRKKDDTESEFQPKPETQTR